MKIIRGLLSLAIGFILIAGCANSTTIKEQEASNKLPSIQDNQEKNQFIQYINQQLNKYSSERDRAVLSYVEASERNNSKEMKQALEGQVIPFYEKSLKVLKQFKPKTDEMYQLHQLLIEKETLYFEIFKLNMELTESYSKETEQDFTNKMNQLQLVRSKFEERLAVLNSKYLLEHTNEDSISKS